MALEAERHDTTWRTSKPVARYAPEAAKPPVIPRRAKPVNELAQKERDRIMFHAGRYAAGARDAEALEATKKVGSLIHKKKEQN